MFLTCCSPRSSKLKGAEVPDLVAHAARDADAAGLGQGLQPGRDVDAVAEDVAALDHDVADIDADAKAHPLVVRHAGTQLGRRLLHPHRTAHGIDDTGELGQDAVAGGVGDPAAEVADELVDDRPVGRQRGQRCLLVRRHQPRIALDIGCQNGDQPAIERGCFHGNPRPRLCR